MKVFQFCTFLSIFVADVLAGGLTYDSDPSSEVEPRSEL